MLLSIFQELQLEVARFLTDPTDCASLCLAVPRGLGLAALRELPQYKDILVSVALRLGAGEVQIDEALLRRYLWEKRMTSEGCVWLTAAAQMAGSPLGIVRSFQGRRTKDQGREWWVLEDGGAEGALVRKKQANGIVVLYVGARDAERKVRVEQPDGTIVLLEGDRGKERMVHGEHPDGRVMYLEGEKGLERSVRTEQPDGTVVLFEGEKDAERMVRQEGPDGKVALFEGEKGAERKVRQEHLDGGVSFFEGKKGAERRVRHEHPGGTERVVRQRVKHRATHDAAAALDAALGLPPLPPPLI